MSTPPPGSLRAAINLANPLLVSRPDGGAGLWGVAPDLAALLAGRLNRELVLVPYATAGAAAAGAEREEWDVALIASDPAREERIAFSRPYALINARFAVGPDSDVRTVADVDRPGALVLAHEGSAYGLWLHEHLGAASVFDVADDDELVSSFSALSAVVVAALDSTLTTLAGRIPGLRRVGEPFMSVRQCVGTPRGSALAGLVDSIVNDLGRAGLVSTLIARYGVGEALSIPADFEP